MKFVKSILVVTGWQLSLLCSAFQTPVPQRPLSRLYRTSDSKWDNLVDEDDEEELVARPDMKYIPRNIQRQHRNFEALRDAGGKDVIHDLYIPEPESGVFWFIGKVASISDVTPEEAVARQWPLIVQHAANLRPVELYPSRAKLEIWMAPGDTELDVAYNRPNVVFQKLSRDVEGAESIKSNMVGFQGEVYETGQGMGFRTWRNPDGTPSKPEIESPAVDEPIGGDVAAPISKDGEYSDPRFRAPTEEELEKLQSALKDKNMDISQLYEEQQQREGEESNQ